MIVSARICMLPLPWVFSYLTYTALEYVELWVGVCLLNKVFYSVNLDNIFMTIINTISNTATISHR